MSSSQHFFGCIDQFHLGDILKKKLNAYTSDEPCKDYPKDEIFNQIISLEGTVSKSRISKLKAKHFQCCAYQIADKYGLDLDVVADSQHVQINMDNVFSALRALSDFKELRDLLKISKWHFEKAGLVCMADEMEALSHGWTAAIDYYMPPKSDSCLKF